MNPLGPRTGSFEPPADLPVGRSRVFFSASARDAASELLLADRSALAARVLELQGELDAARAENAALRVRLADAITDIPGCAGEGMMPVDGDKP